MIPCKSSGLSFALLVVFLSVFGICPMSVAQGPLPEAPTPIPAVERASAFVSLPRSIASEHKFWDRENKVLFFAAAALNGADFAITRSNLPSGGRELNPVVRIFGRFDCRARRQLCGRNGGSHVRKLLLPQDRSPQTRTLGIHR
jgi:hypothetical protein